MVGQGPNKVCSAYLLEVDADKLLDGGGALNTTGAGGGVDLCYLHM